MLAQNENDLLTRVGAETPMGGLMRRYWIPALLAEEIPTPDCAPVRVRLLGEDLVSFRDSQGRAGLLGEHCARGVEDAAAVALGVGAQRALLRRRGPGGSHAPSLLE